MKEKLQHTPGPWILRDEYRKERETVIYKEGPSYCVYTNGFNGDGNGSVLVALATEIEHEKDARLICAAPELLEALRAIENILDGSQPVDVPGAVMVARSAIAKATR